ncbi:MAG: dephospho-CoA kinase [Planctomycetota bacterium]
MIGVLGGVAGGKSLVARELVRLGAGLLDADRAGHDVLCMPEIEAAARDRWGEAIFGADGRIDRARLGEIVFADPPGGPRERTFLERLTHPEIGRKLAREAERLVALGSVAAVLDAPLLLEAGWDRLCDTLVFVDAPRRLRLARARARGWSEADFDARQRAQHSVDAKRKRADVVIDNSGSPEETQAEIERFWHALLRTEP